MLKAIKLVSVIDPRERRVWSVLHGTKIMSNRIVSAVTKLVDLRGAERARNVDGKKSRGLVE